MKKILVLTRYPKEYEPMRLKTEGELMGYEVEIVSYIKIKIDINTEGEGEVSLGEGKKITDYDLVIPRSASVHGKKSMLDIKTSVLKIIEGCRDKEINVVNMASFLKYPLLGKIEQSTLLKEMDFPVIPFKVIKKKDNLDLREVIGQAPAIVKGRFGSHGRKVRLVKKGEDLDKVLGEIRGSILIQPVIRMNSWFRVLVLGGRVIGKREHVQKKKYRVELRGDASFVGKDLERLDELCVRICNYFDCDFAGLDVGWDEDKKDWVLIEINRTPQFSSVEKEEGVNVARKIIEFGLGQV